MDAKTIEDIIKNFNKLNIAIVGDVMLDSYIWGEVNRISPEAPVPIVLSNTREERLGGAGNVVMNIKALGATPILFSVTGNDEKAVLLKKILESNAITHRGIVAENERITTSKTRILGHNQQLLRVDQETDEYIKKETQHELFRLFSKVLDDTKIDACIFQDYDKGVLTTGLIKNITALCQSKGIPTLVDPKKRNFNNFENVTLFKPNFKEFAEGLNKELKKDNFDKIFEVVREFQEKKKIDLFLLTLSELGVFISDKNTYVQIPAKKREIADVSGAGDTVISVASLCLASGMEPADLAEISNLAGGLVCEKVGVVPLSQDILMEYL